MIDHDHEPPDDLAGQISSVEEKLEEIVEQEIELLEELVDLEERAKANKPPRRAKRYRIRIDREHFVVEVHSMTGRELLALVKKAPETYLLSQKLRGGVVEPVGADQIVEFHRHEVERFQTLALDPTEG
jgi:hypothetical protein